MYSSTSMKKKFQEDWFKELTGLTFNHNTWVESCKVCVFCASIWYQNSTLVKSFTGPFEMRTVKEYGKSFQHKICEKANGAFFTPEVIPFITSNIYIKQQNVFENSFKENHFISTCWVREADTTRSYCVKNLIFINKRAITNKEKYIEQV